MKFARLSFAALILGATVFTASCGDSSPVAPPVASQVQAGPGQDNLLGGLTGTLSHTLNGLLLQCSPLPAASTTKTIGVLGGVINVGPHTLVIPPGAVARPTSITASIVGGGHNGVHFEPHGLQFRNSPVLTMSYANCSGLGSLLPKRIVYVDGGLNVLEILLSLDNLWSNNVSARLDHFSDYMIAW